MIRHISAKRQTELRLRAELYPQVQARDSVDGAPCCIRCGKLGNDVHEILGRGHFGHKNMEQCLQMKNACVICRQCHSEVQNPDGRRELFGILARKYSYDYSAEPWREYTK